MPELQYSFDLSCEQTCKAGWDFTVEDGIITRVDIHEREKNTGCQGHPEMLKMLMIGRTLDSLDPDAFDDVSCNREFSCGRAIARCLREMRN